MNDSNLTPFQVNEDCMEQMKTYNWPGNVRELRSTIKNMLPLLREEGKTAITLADLPDEIRCYLEQKNSKQVRKLFGNMKNTDEEIILALKKWKGVRTHAAKELKIGPRQLLRRIKRMKSSGIDVGDP